MANRPAEQSTSTAVDRKTWSAESFYGSSKFVKTQQNDKPLRNELKHKEHCRVLKTELIPSKYTSILGPSRTWRVFRKQHDAIEFAKLRRSELMTFVYEESSGLRIFIVAHPIFFWYNSLKKPLEDRCSYEIIPDKAICKLYFDLEFATEFNPGKDGVRMTNTFIFIIGYHLKKFFQIHTNRSNILDLDSSTDIKFSRHLIYQLSKVVFRDNLQIRDFVKSVGVSIREWIQITKIGDYPEDTDCYIKNHLKVSDLHELVVTDRKGNLGLFCDESVYTKNRHFRLMGSTKRNKNAHLLPSLENEYSSISGADSLDMFLDSLLTYFPPECLDFRMISFENGTFNATEECTSAGKTMPFKDCKPDRHLHSPHPEIDKFISALVTPGHIYRCYYVSSSNLIVYEILGYRYCGNIQREHRSNNIKLIVNINRASYFQTCFDNDCAGYRSNELKLPQEIALLFNKVEVELELTENAWFEDFGVPVDELNKIVSAAERTRQPLKLNIDSLKDINHQSSSKVASKIYSEITDQEMIETMEQFEQLANSSSALCSDHPPPILTKQCPTNVPASPSNSCDELAKWEREQVTELLQNSNDFFEPHADFLDSDSKNVANFDKCSFPDDISEVELNRVMCQIESNFIYTTENSKVKVTNTEKSQNTEIFPGFDMSDTELLSVVFPKS